MLLLEMLRVDVCLSVCLSETGDSFTGTLWSFSCPTHCVNCSHRNLNFYNINLRFEQHVLDLLLEHTL